ncbi:MAG: hypothetical protein HQ519_04645 [Planctomycetes bacterium]|nr:hypothetical protein [Planctomycetota bacterium]
MITTLVLSCALVAQASINPSPATAAQQDLKSDHFSATLNSAGHFTTFIDLRDGANYLPVGQPAPMARLRVNGEYQSPTSISWNGDRATLSFTAGEVEIDVAQKTSHLRFEVMAVNCKSGMEAELLMWGPYPTTISKTIGETIGVVRGEKFAVGLQALNAKTMGGAAKNEHDQMPNYNIFAQSDYVDVGKETKLLFRGDAALGTDFGSTIQAYVRDRSKPRVIANWGHPRFVAPAFEDGGIVGSAIALFACPVEDALATIGEIEIAEGLPHPMIDGEWGKTSRSATAAYLIIGFGEDNIEDAIKLTKKAGLRYLYHGGPFTTWGKFQLNDKQFPNGWDGMKKCVDTARAQGVDVGVHTLSNFITTNDPLVTPVPDPGLAIVGSTELTAAIDAASEELEVADGAWFENKGALRCARIGDELIQYQKVEGNRLLQCKRGAFGTTASAHEAGATVSKLMDHAYRTFLTDAELSKSVAETLADLFNQTGLRQISFDGLEGMWSTGLGQYGRTLLAKWWFDALMPELRGKVINDASNPGHYFWHIYTRMNWGEPWYAGFRESQTHYRLLNQHYFERNLMPRMLGWFKMTAQTSLEDAEWLMARSAGFNAGFAFVTGADVIKANSAGDEILDKIRIWEAARMADAFPAEMLPALQDIQREFSLTETTAGWKIKEVHSFKGKHIRREQPGMPTSTEFAVSNPFPNQPLQFILQCGDKVAAEEIVLEINGTELDLGVSLQPGQTYRGTTEFLVPSGDYNVTATCRFAGSGDPLLKLELRTSNAPRQLPLRR